MLRGAESHTGWCGLVVFLAGVVRDLQWHATHDTQTNFETASKQVAVHWLLFLGGPHRPDSSGGSCRVPGLSVTLGG